MTLVTTTEFRNAFQMRLACVRALLELSRRQAGLIAADDYAELVQTLTHKQQLLDHLSGLTAEQSLLWQTWPRQRETMCADDRECCDSVLAETESLLALLIAEERSSAQNLTEQRDATQRNLQAVACGARAEAAYELNVSPSLSRLNLNT